MSPIKVEGIDYTPEGIEALRADVIKLRDSQYAHWPESIEATLVLSHAIALLAYLRELTEQSRWEQSR
jgi:hypothetical protein